MGEVVAAAAEVERRGDSAVVPVVGVPVAGGAIRTGAPPAPAGTRWCAGRRRPCVSRRSTNSWRAASSSRTRSSSSSSLASISSRSVPETSTPASRRRASAASARLASVSGRRCSRASASAASPRSIRMRARPSVAAGVVRLELEGPAQRGLVARGDQRVRLARRGRQALDERGHLRLGHRADELVHHLAVADGEDGGDGLHGEGLGDPRVLVDVDLGQLDRAPGVGDGLLEHGPERLAGPAPGRPQVDDHRHRRAAVQHLGLECLIGDVHRPRR